MAIRSICPLFVLLSLLHVHVIGEPFDPVKRIMSMRAAEESARRSLAESLSGVKIASSAEASLADNVITGSFQLDAHVSATMSGVAFFNPVYDYERDIARVSAEIDAEGITRATGITNISEGLRMSRIGFGTSTPSSAGAVRALRAAEVDAYRQLAEYVMGLEITGRTKVRDYVVESVDVTAQMVAVIYGATEDASDPYGFTGNTAYVRLNTSLETIKTALGVAVSNNVNVISVTGRGAIE